MTIRHVLVRVAFAIFPLLAIPVTAQAQTTDDSKWVAEVGIGIAPSINGNVNSGAIGTLNGMATAMLPNSYGDVYGTGIDFRFGGGYRLNDLTELRGIFSWQTADANLVRLGDIGPSSLYAQYSDYKSIGLDFGLRRYLPISGTNLHVFGEAAIGIAAIDRINVKFAAPQANAIFEDTDFYDGTAAFTWKVAFGAVFRVSPKVDLTAEFGFRHVGGLSSVDQFQGTGLETINNDSARLTFPIVIGLRFRL